MTIKLQYWLGTYLIRFRWRLWQFVSGRTSWPIRLLCTDSLRKLHASWPITQTESVSWEQMPAWSSKSASYLCHVCQENSRLFCCTAFPYFNNLEANVNLAKNDTLLVNIPYPDETRGMTAAEFKRLHGLWPRDPRRFQRLRSTCHRYRLALSPNEVRKRCQSIANIDRLKG